MGFRGADVSGLAPAIGRSERSLVPARPPRSRSSALSVATCRNTRTRTSAAWIFVQAPQIGDLGVIRPSGPADRTDTQAGISTPAGPKEAPDSAVSQRVAPTDFWHQRLVRSDRQ